MLIYSFNSLFSIIIIIIIIILLIWEFFTPALADGFRLDTERQQVPLSLRVSWYSGRSQQCYSFDDLDPSSYFQILQSLYQSFSDRTERADHNWYLRHFHVPPFFQLSSKVLVLISLVTVLSQLWSAGRAKSTIQQVLFFLFAIIESGRPVEIRWSVCFSKLFCISFSWTDSV